MVKKITALLLAVSLSMLAAGCFQNKKAAEPSASSAVSSQSGVPSSSEEEEEPEEGTPAAAVADMLDAFQKAEMEQLENVMEDAGILALAEDAQQLLKELAQNMRYELGETKITGDTAIVSADITNSDFSGVTEQLIAALVGIALTNPDADRQEMGGLILEELSDLVKDSGNETVHFEVDIPMVRENEEWKIQQQPLPEELLNAVSGGLYKELMEMAGQLGSLVG
ncbi:MAG: hypothetical protein HFG27_04730 [Provencibacterium sp.]|jgi:hypothetical protein|nr:hypothetical protein [Provencibacterium sp.]